MQAQQLKQKFVATFLEQGQTEKRVRITLTINKHVCLEFSSFKITLFPI